MYSQVLGTYTISQMKLSVITTYCNRIIVQTRVRFELLQRKQRVILQDPNRSRALAFQG